MPCPSMIGRESNGGTTSKPALAPQAPPHAPADAPSSCRQTAPRHPNVSRHPLSRRRGLRHHDDGRHAEALRGERHRLAVIARRVGDDAACPIRLGQLREKVVGAADLECADRLHLLALDVKRAAGAPGLAPACAVRCQRCAWLPRGCHRGLRACLGDCTGPWVSIGTNSGCRLSGRGPILARMPVVARSRPSRERLLTRSAVGASAQLAAQPGPFVLDVRGAYTSVGRSEELAAPRGLAVGELPKTVLGIDVGAHFYPIRRTVTSGSAHRC